MAEVVARGSPRSVYAIVAPDGAVKVGIAGDGLERVKQLAWATKQDLSVFFQVRRDGGGAPAAASRAVHGEAEEGDGIVTETTRTYEQGRTDERVAVVAHLKGEFAERLAEIMADAAGRPLTAEERARTHEHVRQANLALGADMREEIENGT